MLDEKNEILLICYHLTSCRTKGELARRIASEMQRYSVFDLQVICGRLHHDLERLPAPYREAVRPFFIDQIFGTHHQILLAVRSEDLRIMDEPIANPGIFLEFLAMVREACFSREMQSEYIPEFNSPFHGLFYYLMAGYTMFVLGLPGHPVGMPFPGGLCVEEKEGIFFCPVREKEKEVSMAICNFCPAKQTETP